MTEFQICHTERDTERRFKILEGCAWDLDQAQKLWFWINHGMTFNQMMEMMPPTITSEKTRP